jgi:hypothetical protein
MQESDPNYAQHFKTMLDTIQKVNPTLPVQQANQQAKAATDAAPAYTTDTTFYRITVILLGSIVLTVVIGSFLLIGTSHTPTDGIIAVGSAAAGGLVGIFSTKK